MSFAENLIIQFYKVFSLWKVFYLYKKFKMKKLLLILSVFFFSFLSAQETDFDKIMAFAKIIMYNENIIVKEKAFADFKNLKNQTKEPAALVAISQMEGKLENLLNIDRVTYTANDVDFSDKKKFKEYRIENDKFKKATFIYAKGYYNPPDFNSYIVLNDGKINLRLETFYSGSGWLFMKKVIALVNDEKIEFDLYDPSRDLGYPKVSEKADNLVDENILKFMRAAADPNSDVEIRLQGEKYTDFKLSKMTKEKFSKILALYDEIKK